MRATADGKSCRRQRWWLLAATGLLVTACGSGSTSAPAASRAGEPAPSTAAGHAQIPSAKAAALARQIAGCQPQALQPSDLSTPGLRPIKPAAIAGASAVTCRLRGRVVVVFAFGGGRSEEDMKVQLRRIDNYYAAGRTWVAAPEEIDEPAGEQSVVQDVALALHGQIVAGNPGGSA